MTTSQPITGSLRALCHATRIVAVAWILWSVTQTVIFWSDSENARHVYGRIAGQSLPPLSVHQHVACILIVTTALLAAVAVVFYVWRLFGYFIEGQVFSPGTVDCLVALGCSGVAATLTDILARPAIFSIVAGEIRLWGEPNDLLHVMMAFFVVIVAQVIKAGTAIADENREIV